MGLCNYSELVTILRFELHGHSSVHAHWQFGHVYCPWHLTCDKMYQDLPLFIVGRVWEWGCSHLHKRQVPSISCQLSTSTYYQPLTFYANVRWFYVCACVVSEQPFHFSSVDCVNCAVTIVLTTNLCRTKACASHSQKIDSDWSYHSSKPAEQGSSSYAGTLRHSSSLLPISLAMAKVYPAESAISVSCFIHSCFIAEVIQFSCLSTCHWLYGMLFLHDASLYSFDCSCELPGARATKWYRMHDVLTLCTLTVWNLTSGR